MNNGKMDFILLVTYTIFFWEMAHSSLLNTNSNDNTIFCGFGIISEIIDPSDCWAVFLSLSDAAWYDENGSMVGRSAFVPKAKRKNSRLGSKARSPTALGYETNFWESTCAAAVGTNTQMCLVMSGN